MRVNNQKTQLLCINAIHDRDLDVYIRLGGSTKITGQESLKQLGFIFGKRPNVDMHLQTMSLKFRRRL